MIPYPPASHRLRCDQPTWWLRFCIHRTNTSTSAIGYVRSDKTTSNRVRTYDTVGAGTFFPIVLPRSCRVLYALHTVVKERHQECRERTERLGIKCGVFGELVVRGFRRQHPGGDLQTGTGLVHDRNR